jgi:hypothetical protein
VALSDDTEFLNNKGSASHGNHKTAENHRILRSAKEHRPITLEELWMIRMFEPLT